MGLATPCNDHTGVKRGHRPGDCSLWRILFTAVRQWCTTWPRAQERLHSPDGPIAVTVRGRVRATVTNAELWRELLTSNKRIRWLIKYLNFLKTINDIPAAAKSLPSLKKFVWPRRSAHNKNVLKQKNAGWMFSRHANRRRNPPAKWSICERALLLLLSDPPGLACVCSGPGAGGSWWTLSPRSWSPPSWSSTSSSSSSPGRRGRREASGMSPLPRLSWCRSEPAA